MIQQRFVLALFAEAVCPDAVQELSTCMKPGGRNQLHEGDMTVIDEGPQREMASRFLNLWSKLEGNQLIPMLKLKNETRANILQHTI